MMWKGLVVALCALVFAPTAEASSTPNSCRFSIDNWYRDLPVALDTTASIVPDARYPSPVDVEPGQTVKTAVGTAGVELPHNLAQYGYIVGLLHEGYNEIPVDVWIAVRATNTKERVQVVGPIRVTASTTIAVDPADDNRFVSSTPWQYTTPVIPATTWTAVGGDIVFSQADGGSLGPLPIGPGGSNRTPIGSVVINALIPGGLIFYMDCQPGATNDVSPVDLAGPSLTPGPAVPFASLIGPRNLTCLSSLGRQVSGAPANLPAGIDRELDPLRASLSVTGAPATFVTGTPYALPAATLNATLSGDTMATLGRFDDGGPIVSPGTSYGADVWVTITASNTAEGTRTVRGVTSYVPTAGYDAVALSVSLPATTWTPTGAGPIRFALGQARSSAAVQIVGPATGGPGGPIVDTEFTLTPLGSVVVALGTERNRAVLDCAPAAIRVADPTVPWSNTGASAARYGIDPNLDTPALATATDATPPVTPTPTPTPIATASPTPQPPPPPPVVKRPAGSVYSTLLSARGKKAQLRIACPSGSLTCTGTVTVKSTAKVRIGKRSKIITIARPLKYTVAPGRRRTFSLKLSADARKALKAKRKVRVRITLTTSEGVTASRRVDLRR